MSISVDESGPEWVNFITREKAKFPHFGKRWFDNNGEISSNRGMKRWKWEINQYLEDRRSFLETLIPPEVQIPPPPIADSKASEPIKDSKPSKATSSNSSEKRRPALTTSPEKKKKPLVKKEPTTSKLAGSAGAKQHSAHTAKMPRRTKRSQAWRSRRRRGGNKALASVKIPFKIAIAVDSKSSGTETGHWHNHLSIAELAGDALKLHEEFKCCSLKVRYIPEDITTGAGLYAACLLDQNGFGDPAKATTTWFPRVADLPGARLCHITRGCAFTWHPTEPDSRNYRKVVEEKDYKVCSFYIFGNSASLSIKGQLLITGLLRARGEFYAANITKRIQELSLHCDKESFEEVSVA